MAYTPEMQQLYLEVNFSFSSYIFAKKKTKTFSTVVKNNAKAIKCTIHIIYAKILIIFTQLCRITIPIKIINISNISLYLL